MTSGALARVFDYLKVEADIGPSTCIRSSLRVEAPIARLGVLIEYRCAAADQ